MQIQCCPKTRVFVFLICFVTSWPLTVHASFNAFNESPAMASGARAGDHDIRVTDMGARGDGVTLNTAAIQKAIDRCHDEGGGKVIFPPGNYLTGTIAFQDNVTLYLDKGATLLGSLNLEDYSNKDPFKDGLGVDVGWALIVGVDKHHIGIAGQGAINGQGEAIKARQIATDNRPESKRWGRRPFLLRLVRCEGIKVQGVQLLYAAAWTSHYFQCRDVEIEGLKIESHGVAHNDGIDIDGCQQVQIKNCAIYSGDDAVCFKTTSSKMACKDITVSGMRLRSNQAGIKIGTESMADFENIQISDCYIYETRNGGIKLLTVDGAHIRNIRISDIKMTEVKTPILLRLGSRLSVFRKGVDKQQSTGSMENILLENIQAQAADNAQLKPPSGVLITGVPGHRIKGVVLRNISIGLLGMGTAADAAVPVPEAIDKYPEVKTFGPTIPAYGIWARHIDGLTLDRVRFTLKNNDLRPALFLEDAQGLRMTNCQLPVVQGAAAIIRLNGANDIHIERVKAAGTADSFVEASATNKEQVHLKDNMTSGAKVPLRVL